ncbi:proprotein convertase subtilisin/kexin type 4-like isoform X2 [Leucoraja erinacea]|uniref:proprotein convertase subtilisin/kexin type 4-like isoform X2 n=1 Tax=Leucoraja erinaceus TaxID=7782 RepID=UPI0024589733|nr:proprotein convertase subtilisin/kexin type 4-like isoform X2 [Leucoraja erinacea]
MSCRRHRRLLHLLLLLLLVPGARQPFAGTRAVRAPDASPLYTNTWAVRVPGGAEHARSIARRHGFINFGRIFEDEDYYYFKHKAVWKRSINPHQMRHRRLEMEPKNNEIPNDLNVLSAWKRGYTGKGIVITILDDGIEKNHPDLAANYDPDASFDINDNDPDPQPRYNYNDENRHGTRCAGEVAAVANNICGVGVAFNAKIGGVRMLDGEITDVVEARSLSLNPQHIHIYSASWGPEDNGQTVEGPAMLASRAFLKGITNGRGGLGSIFVWASGNGGFQYDNCNCDGYTNSIYTLSVGSTTEQGNIPWYSEACSSTLTTTYSSGTRMEKQIVTTDLRLRCTEKHTGTSASAPLAAGIIALAMEANPALTWRDMQHLVVRASKPLNLKADDWAKNGVGRKVSHHYGYGLLDAGRLVDLATKWLTVHPQRECSIEIIKSPQVISDKLVIKKHINACSGTKDYIRSLEHVEARMSLSYTRRGDLRIYLISPSGTCSNLVDVRPHDASPRGYRDWTFMTIHCWDEDPKGVWTLKIENKGSSRNTGVLSYFKMQLYGTEEDMMARRMKDTVINDCGKWNEDGLCQECRGAFVIFGRHCLSDCPPHYYSVARTLNKTVNGVHKTLAVLACDPCHSSCYSCNGSSQNDCVTCPSFSNYDENQHSCSPPIYPSRSNMNEREDQKHGLYKIAVILAILIGAPVAVMCCVMSLSWLICRLNIGQAFIVTTSATGATEATQLQVHRDTTDEGTGSSETESTYFLTHLDQQ